MHAVGRGAIELEMAVGLEKMIMAADLDRAVAGVGHLDGRGFAPGIELDVTLGGNDFARHDSILLGQLLLARPDRIVDRDQLGAVRKGPLHLNHRRHRRDTRHDVVGGEQLGAEGDQVCDRASVAGALEDFVADQGDRLGVVELDAPGAALARQLGGAEDL